MKNKIVVLGAGLVGRAIALDLSESFEVTSVDLSDDALGFMRSKGVNTVKADLSNAKQIGSVVKDADLVVGAVPGFMGFRTVQTIIESRKDMVDISFFPEDAFQLDSLARANNVTIVTDCGVAPGMGNIILGYHHKRMTVERYECLVGGLPVVREWPFEYKAVFSPIDVIEEYVRPARYVQNGKIVIKEALSDAELIHFPGVGTLESWNSDGLRSLIKTIEGVPDMIEKTLRYPGCIEYLKVLRDAGFFSYETVELNGVSIRPVDVTAKLLFPRWKLKPGEEEFTVMRIRVDGTENGAAKSYQYNLLDRTDKKSGILSMARTTGYTCTAVANLVLKKRFSRKGICPPEYVGMEDGNLEFIMAYLKARGVIYDVIKN
jgi:lysine 6-dehydrogenase